MRVPAPGRPRLGQGGEALYGGQELGQGRSVCGLRAGPRADLRLARAVFGEREGFGTHPGVGVTEEVLTLLEALGSRSHGVGIRCQAESQFSLCPSMALGSHTTAAASPACLCLGSLCPWVPPIDSADAGICHRFLQAWALET